MRGLCQWAGSSFTEVRDFAEICQTKHPKLISRKISTTSGTVLQKANLSKKKRKKGDRSSWEPPG